MIQLLHGTAESRLPALHSNSVHLTVTSPPYSNQRNYADGFNYDFDTVAKELFRVTCNGGVVCWNEGLTCHKSDEKSDPYDHVLGFKRVGFKLLQTLIIRKDSIPFPNRYRYGNQFEFCWVLLKGDKVRTFHKIKDRLNLQFGKTKNVASGRRGPKDTIQRSNKTITISKLGYRSNVWDVGVGFNKTTKDRVAYEHPALMAEALADSLVLSYSNKGDTVLDLFSGAGTTAKRACLNDRHAIGVERSKKYVSLSARRLKHYTQDVVIC